MEKDEVKDKQTWKQAAGYDVLAVHIVKQAMYDYNTARKKKDYATTMGLLRFFRSEWCQFGISPSASFMKNEKIYADVKHGRRKNAKIGNK